MQEQQLPPPCRLLYSYLLADKLRNNDTMALPAIAEVSSLPATERAKILDLLFEPCTQLHTLSLELLTKTSFSSYSDLIASIGLQLTELAESSSTSDKRWLEDILTAHPRLGEKKVDSDQSRTEQAQLHTGGEEEAARLEALNTEYERVFSGLRYV